MRSQKSNEQNRREARSLEASNSNNNGGKSADRSDLDLGLFVYAGSDHTKPARSLKEPKDYNY